MSITVLIVDDQPLQRLGMKMFLDGQQDIEVVGEAGDGAEAITQTRMLTPDVILMDIRMPGTDGIAATKSIVSTKGIVSTKTSSGGPWVLLLTTFDLDEYVLAGLEAGASGFLTKDAQPGELLSAIRAVAAGDAVIAPSATRRLLTRLATGQPPRPREAASATLEHMTHREREILTAIGQGMTNTEIAARFFLAESTVKSHVGRIFVKIGARDRVQAVITAYRSGLVSLD